MSERGVFAVDRGIWDHDVLAENEPFSRREAWLWLLSEAAWKPHKVRRVGRSIELNRGQLAHSVRFIGSQWRWHETRVRRFLAALKAEEMVDAKTDAAVTVVTICKYAEYQRVSLPNDAATEVIPDAPPTQERRKVEDREYKEDSEANASGANAPLDDPSKPEREYFARGREILGKSAGGQLTKLLKANGGNVSLSRSTLELAATKHRPAEFFARAITPQSQGPPAGKGGFTSVLMDKHAERQHGTSDSEPEFIIEH